MRAAQTPRADSLSPCGKNAKTAADILPPPDRTLSETSGSIAMAVGAGKINDSGNALGAISSEMKRTISKIGEQIDRFRSA